MCVCLCVCVDNEWTDRPVVGDAFNQVSQPVKTECAHNY